MDEIWERAIKTALDGETDSESVRNLTLDGAVKCFQVRFPPPCLLQKFCNLEHLSIANAGVSSLENFPNLPRLQKLVLSDNRIAGGLDYLVRAGLENLRDLDLSNNRIQFINDLVPLAELKIMSLDLYECPVTKVVNYRGQVFGLVRSVKYLDKMDENQNERLESDDDEDDEEQEVEMLSKMSSWGNVVDVDEDEESDADEDESEMVKGGNSANEEGLDDDVEEIDEEDSEDEEVFEVHEVHEIDDSDDEDGDEDSDDDDEDDELEEVDDEEVVQPVSTGRLTSAEGEIDGHDNGEEDENGEIGEEEVMSSEEDGTCGDDDLEDEDGTEFLVQPAGQHEEYVGGSDFDAGEEDDYSGEEDEVDDKGVFIVERQSQPSKSPQLKRMRDEDDAVEEDGGDGEKVENGDLKSHLSMSAQLKKRINGAVEDAKDEGGQKSMDAGKVEKAPVKL